MVNAGLVALISLTIILTLFIVVSLILVAVKSIRSNNGSNVPNSLPPCLSTVNINSLLQIPSNYPNCVQQGITGSLFYIGNLGSGKYDYVVAPWGTNPSNVCIGYCSSYNNGVCLGPNYNGKSAQINFDQCMKQLTSTGCSPPLPIAAQGTKIYYALYPTCNSCDGCGNPPIKNINSSYKHFITHML